MCIRFAVNIGEHPSSADRRQERQHHIPLTDATGRERDPTKGTPDRGRSFARGTSPVTVTFHPIPFLGSAHAQQAAV